MAEVKKFFIARGPANKYDPAGKHKDVLYFAEDEHYLAINGERTTNHIDSSHFHVNDEDIILNSTDIVPSQNVSLGFYPSAILQRSNKKNNRYNTILSSIQIPVKVLEFSKGSGENAVSTVTVKDKFNGFPINALLVSKQSFDEYVRSGGIHKLRSIVDSKLKYALLGEKVDSLINKTSDGKLDSYTMKVSVIESNLDQKEANTEPEDYYIITSTIDNQRSSITSSSTAKGVINSIILGNFNSVENSRCGCLLGYFNTIKRVHNSTQGAGYYTLIGYNNTLLGDLQSGYRTGLYDSTVIGNNNGIITANASVLIGNRYFNYVDLKKKDGVDNKYYFSDRSDNVLNNSVTVQESYLIKNFTLKELQVLFNHAAFSNQFPELYISEVTIEDVGSKKKILFTTSKPLENYFTKLTSLNIIPYLAYNNNVNVGFGNFTVVVGHGSNGVSYGIGNFSLTDRSSVTYGISNVVHNSWEISFGIFNVSIPGVSALTLGVGDDNSTDGQYQKNAYMYTNDGRHFFAGIGGYTGKEFSLTSDIKDLKSVLDSKVDKAGISELASKKELQQKVDELNTTIQALNSTIDSLTQRIVTLEKKLNI